MQVIDDANIPKGIKGASKKTLHLRSRSRPTTGITPPALKKDEGKRDAWYCKVSVGGTKPTRTCTLLAN